MQVFNVMLDRLVVPRYNQVSLTYVIRLVGWKKRLIHSSPAYWEQFRLASL